MKVYTKKGDEGFTSRPGVPKMRKSDLVCHALGAVDELNAHIGWCLHAAVQAENDDIQSALSPIQPELFCVGALLAATGSDQTPKGVILNQACVDRIEHQIDTAWTALPKLTHFILPGGCELACRLHVARTVCRRAERALVVALDAGYEVAEVLPRYVNRLSDLLFTLARLANHMYGTEDTLWSPPQDKDA